MGLLAAFHFVSCFENKKPVVVLVVDEGRARKLAVIAGIISITGCYWHQQRINENSHPLLAKWKQQCKINH